MSRNTEKAQSSLNRFLAFKNKEAGVLESNPSDRPKYVQSVTSLPQAEKWRSVVLGEISTRLTRIQDPSLGDSQIRELNDTLNKLFREKRAWEYHIKDLGGNDYINYGKGFSSIGKVSNEAGVFLNGYRYFGRAKELPDVKEILTSQKKEKDSKKEQLTQAQEEKRIIQDRLRRIDASYYGFYDESANVNMEIDASRNSTIKQMNQVFQEDVVPVEEDTDCIGFDDDGDDLIIFERKKKQEFIAADDGYDDNENDNETGFSLANIKNIPTSEEVSKWVIEKKRKELIMKLGILS